MIICVRKQAILSKLKSSVLLHRRGKESCTIPNFVPPVPISYNYSVKIKKQLSDSVNKRHNVYDSQEMSASVASASNTDVEEEIGRAHV